MVLGLLFFAVFAGPAFADTVTFTNNTAIGYGDTNYDGMDIVITNCTVTIDGPHTFSSVQVESSGVLTHSFAPTGILEANFPITGEEHELTTTNPAALDDDNDNVVPGSVIVTDLTGTEVYSNGLDYTVIGPGNTAALLLTTNSSISNGATVLVDYQVMEYTSSGVDLDVTGAVIVDSGGTINATAIGYGGDYGYGTGGVEAGGGFGGAGGIGASNGVGGVTYGSYGNFGSYDNPIDSGGGGGIGDNAGKYGGNGGGLIYISAGGPFVVNGSVAANGGNATNSRSGGGAGGGIVLSAETFGGSGVIMANGGNGDLPYGGGGGGGRIAIQYGSSSFSGSMTAYGGAGYSAGGAGSVYTNITGQSGTVVFDNGGRAGAKSTAAIDDTEVSVIVQGEAMLVPFESWQLKNLLINSNGLVTVTTSTTIISQVLNLTFYGLVEIAPGGSMTADGQGNLGGKGPGAGVVYTYPNGAISSGGGYGGTGGAATNNGGAAFGSQTTPNAFGSGGGGNQTVSFGGKGGGWIMLTSDGGTLRVDGNLSANGWPGAGPGSGGGSGGTISVTGATLIGTGQIVANGGAAGDSMGGGGGGGRIALSLPQNSFSGSMTAFGGAGLVYGGAGTIWSSATGSMQQLIVDNGGNHGTNTPIQTLAGGNLIVRNDGVATASGSPTFGNLYVQSNGWLAGTYGNGSTAYGTVNFNVTGSAIISAGGGIVADLEGYAASGGLGEGRAGEANGITYGGGGGHGGLGGNSLGNYATGGSTYDSPLAPIDAGSGGGSTAATSLGGNGGGIIKVTVNGTLEVDGTISANGGNGTGLAGGGGSGGSVWLVAGSLAGTGAISANGGNGVPNGGGGGGGGMVYLSCSTNAFTGAVTAYGGTGANPGGMGTFGLQLPNQNPKLVIDGNGIVSPPGILANLGLADVTLKNGASAVINNSITLGNLIITSNSWLIVSNSEFAMVILGTADIQQGGGITADYLGYASSQGSGTGRFSEESPYACGGGGHGGSGGNGVGGILGGTTYDSDSSPSQRGSGGGGFVNYSYGGSGGGVVLLNVTGLLQLDGVVTANGANGSGAGGGGGSGGSIRLTAGILAGNGSIRANGGAGASTIGGGGGGGCVAVIPTTNLFTGIITAYGGGGATYGGAGPVYIQPQTGNAQLILDNDGNLGTNTPIQNYQIPDLFIRGCAMASAGSYSTVISGNLNIASNGWISPTFYEQGSEGYAMSLSVAGSATIQRGGGILLDGAGYAGGVGTGAGKTATVQTNTYASGAGHGGIGGSGYANSVTGGPAYDIPISPGDPGSGGGGTEGVVGGSGGGELRLAVTGTLEMDGTVSVNGTNGLGSPTGGGSGGSIWITAGNLSGSGVIQANGGNGSPGTGGGGAGGMIYISCVSNKFAGATTAYGGGGANYGGPGTVVIQTTGQNEQFVLDGGGNSGPPTPVNGSSGTVNLTLLNGARANVPLGSTFGNLFVSSNSWVILSNTANTTIGFANAAIEQGGGITGDAMGYAAGAGPFAGKSANDYSCGGGGHGGNGGASATGDAAGGVDYSENVILPASAGGGGGTVPYYSIGGAGGAAFTLNVSGVLELDGTLTANGGGGSGVGGGGGAGGSIVVTGGTITGSGRIQANGGPGAGTGGGGGGGCIAISSTSDQFTGFISAYGGAGANVGGAGTVYFGGNSQTPLLVLDNDGQIGGSTPLNAQALSVLVTNGAALFQLSTRSFANLTICSNSSLITPTNALSGTVTGNLVVAAGGHITVDGRGYGSGAGSGAGQSSTVTGVPGGGGGYGGFGGNSISNLAAGGAPYYSALFPNGLPGSGGGSSGTTSVGGAGGGFVEFTVNGNTQIDGSISANGNNGGGLVGGGGSGGTVSLIVNSLSGNGVISANGGNGAKGQGGGGSGGRIAIKYTSTTFNGAMTAYGGTGGQDGGAGVISLTSTSPVVQEVIVDNGGLDGALTPLSPALGFPTALNTSNSTVPANLVIQNGAAVCPQTNAAFPELGNLTMSSGGYITSVSNAPLDVEVANNAIIGPGASIILDGEGYMQGAGPGAGIGGSGTNMDGSGAGYGGIGGASLSSLGGASYGSALQPTDLGSGGGFGFYTKISGGSEGGGALRLNVGGLLTLNGEISAEGTPGLQDNSGGGSGGSIWVSSSTLTGSGFLAADGGAGQYGTGGGGAGGRIAVFASTLDFEGGASAQGGSGYMNGANGSITISNFGPLHVVSNSPNGIVSGPVSSITLYFNTAPNPNTMFGVNFALRTPDSVVHSNIAYATQKNLTTWVVNFPPQSAPGLYTFLLSSNVVDLSGQPYSPINPITFIIAQPQVQGRVTDGSGNPIAGVLLTASPGASTVITDTNGNYSLNIAPASTVTVTPSFGSYVFAPSSISYTNLQTVVSNQNYIGLSTIAPTLTGAKSGGNFLLSWQGYAGLSYQVYSSINLVSWSPYGSLIYGTNGPIQISVPTISNFHQYFSVGVGTNPTSAIRRGD